MSAQDTYAVSGNGMGVLAGLRKFYSLDQYKSDTVDLPFVTRGICLDVAGTLSYIGVDDTASVTQTLAIGIYHPIRAKRIMASNCTATGIVGGY